MPKPQKPQDVYVVNGWYLNIPFPGINSDGLFETLEGMGKSSETVDVVDGGTNKRYKFTNQITDYSDMTLTRPYNGTPADRAMEVLVNTMIDNGLKLPVTATKLHQGKVVFTIVFEGFGFNSANYPEFNTGGGEKFTVSYQAHCDGYTIIPAGA